ncbi:DUF2515 domain-containing protein [Priestia megaterium]|nr:DUF2515 domain-containing protein [Priestia megaterium]
MIYSLPKTNANTNPLMTDKQIQTLKNQAFKQLHPSKSTLLLTEEDLALIKRINAVVTFHNRNNLTRTQAYFDFYNKHPEIHWAFLAHLVSRNSGYYMTDLQTDFIKRMLSPVKHHAFFLFLERSNAAIFQDAYAQLLLYEASKIQKKNLFYLLSRFCVSSFMEPIWHDFLTNHNKHLLSIALIINEQHHIEQKIIQHPHIKLDVIDTWQFYLQNVLGMTQILFPYYEHQTIALTGLKISYFKSVKNRIEAGKFLYSLLFFNDCLRTKIWRFTYTNKHTGSRSDYDPKSFSANPANTQKTYSPTLSMCWGDRTHVFLNKGDWLQDFSSFHFLKALPVPPFICYTE